MTEIVEKVFRARGAGAKLFMAVERGLRGGEIPPTILIDGPAGSGKSRPAAEAIYRIVDEFPCRVVFARATRKSLTQSVLATWEQEVVHPDDPMLRGPQRDHRQSYRSRAGAEIIPLGIRDNPESTKSLQADIVWVEEASEFTLHEKEMLYRMLRTRDDPKQLPFKLLLMTTNPDGPGHHLYRSFMRGEITRWKSRHEDNPIIQESDLARLRAYTGVRRQRMYEGLWVAAEGAVFQNFDASVHIAEMPRLENGAVDLVGLGTKRVIAGWDWGYTSPGALLVAAVNGDRRIHIVAQVYRNLMPLDWWVEEIAKLHRLYGIERLVVDPSRPECIDAVNRKLSPRGSPLAIGADNQRTWTGKGDMAGIDLLRQMLEPMDHDGRPQLLIGEKSLIGLDDGLHQMALPCSLEDEFPLLRYAPLKEGQRDKEHTDPSGVDHALDAARYIANHVRRISPTPVVPIFKPGAAGDILGHAAELERIRAREASFRSDDDDY